MMSQRSLCVAIRRGDFVGNARYSVCSVDYYRRGISYILQHYAVECLFVCSDDVNWAETNLKDVLGTMTVFYQPQGVPSWEVLRLMSVCQYFVISNSTFAWWAQHLCTRPGKVVVAPKMWRNESPSVHDIFENGWILL